MSTTEHRKPTPEYNTKKKDLIKILRSTAPGSREYEVTKVFLETKAQESLTRATWVLGFATVGLIAAAVAQLITLLATRA